jgi:two-component system cell cycle response regulator
MTARILIVDDVPANTRLLEAKLTAEYYQVASVRDGQTALARAAEWQPDLILLDVMMPGMDGYECCRRLKGDDRTLHIPVVMITALGEPVERIQGLEAGADDFLTKPVEYDTLMARVRSLARLKRLLDEWRIRGETARALGLIGSCRSEPRVAGARALVVDDWQPGADAVQAALQREGVASLRARTIAEAMALTVSNAVDLIVLSLSMAAEDPLLLASSLRAADATHDIPMLLIAEPEPRGRILRGFDLGANDWVTLPLDETELRLRARNQIRRKFYQDRLRADLGMALEMALIDPLTGLYNQRYLMRHLYS